MNKTMKIALAIVVIVIVIASVAAYVYLSTPSSPALESAVLKGAGATFPAPFINATIAYYTTNVQTNVQIDYPGGGSGAGINAFTDKTVDFAGSDAPLSASQRAAAPNALHIPETIGAITIAYNLPGVTAGLKLTGQIVSDIYIGTITKWNDPAIQDLNTGTTLPDQNIITVHRSDSSGTTNWFTKYLDLVSSTWDLGNGTSVQWPIGTGASGNPGVAATVQSTTNALGYVELAYALQNSMTVAIIQNSAGNWIAPSLASTTAAAEALTNLPAGDGDWGSVSILNTAGAQAYPIVTPTYLLVYKELNVVPNMDQNKATQLVQFLWYIVHGGQSLASDLEYATLPSNVVQVDEASINSITFNGQTLR
jgi:phosphate transport system substrate-binding protein